MFKTSNLPIFTGIVMLCLFILSGCTTNPQIVEVTVLVPQTIIVSEEVIVTATSIPPTDTPEITPTPSFQKWTCNDVVQAFKKANLEIEGEYPMTKDDYGMAPMRSVEGMRFLIPSLCADCGGRILSFSSQDDLDITKSYYEELAKSSALFFSWLFVNDNILVQINGDLSEAKAREYETTINNLS
jgi:hypothetical protein